MTLSTQPYKGARDFYPEDKAIQKYMFQILASTVESFGYEEYDAPILEPLEIYTAKTSDEIVAQQTYTFTDRGDRQVVIRPEMTPSVSRMVAAKRHQLTYPLRWYSIPNLWRYERPQRGRYREHWQLNVDLFGEQSLVAEQEMIVLADQIFKNFGADHSMYQIRLNSRLLMDLITKDYLGLSPDRSTKLIKLIDKRSKLEASDFAAQALDIVKTQEVADKLETVLNLKSIDGLAKPLKSSPAAVELGTLISSLSNELGIENVVYDPSLARGFDYYSDVVFEIFDNHPDNNRSMMGGGRYDGLVGLYGVDPVPTIGFGLGDATLLNFLQLHDLLPQISSRSDLAVLLLGDVNLAAHKLIAQLRGQGLNVVVDFSQRKLGQKIKWAETKGLRFVLVIGEKELKSEQLNIKDLTNGQEDTIKLDDIYAFLKSQK